MVRRMRVRNKIIIDIIWCARHLHPFPHRNAIDFIIEFHAMRNTIRWYSIPDNIALNQVEMYQLQLAHNLNLIIKKWRFLFSAKLKINEHPIFTQRFIIFTPLRKHIFIYKQIYLLIIPQINFKFSFYWYWIFHYEFMISFFCSLVLFLIFTFGKHYVLTWKTLNHRATKTAYALLFIRPKIIVSNLIVNFFPSVFI